MRYQIVGNKHVFIFTHHMFVPTDFDVLIVLLYNCQGSYIYESIIQNYHPIIFTDFTYFLYDFQMP